MARIQHDVPTQPQSAAPPTSSPDAPTHLLGNHSPPRIVLIGLIYACLIAVSEIALLRNPVIASMIYVVLLATFVIHAALGKSLDERRFLLCLSLAPLIRILSPTLPLQHIRLIYWYGIIAIPLVVAAAVAAQLAGLTWRSLGLRLTRPWIQILVIALGLVLGTTEYLILRPAPLISHLTLGNLWLPAIILILGTGFTEEFVFRGVMQASARGVFRDYAVIYVSVVFACLHIGYKSIVDLVFVLAVGLLFGYVAQRTGSILGTSLSHGIANVVLYLIVPFIGLPALMTGPVHVLMPLHMTAEYRVVVPLGRLARYGMVITTRIPNPSYRLPLRRFGGEYSRCQPPCFYGTWSLDSKGISRQRPTGGGQRMWLPAPA